uniref:Uncharacterized protein n=1 Tax=Rhizobium leguminosarum bv. trifolii TaxID=386 RepID=A0A1C9HSQ3_RHILT|nr:hypothetical protein [Rhizobium leguminosarum bv. trifolii]
MEGEITFSRNPLQCDVASQKPNYSDHSTKKGPALGPALPGLSGYPLLQFIGWAGAPGAAGAGTAGLAGDGCRVPAALSK